MAYGVNAPFGLKPLFSMLGGSWTEKLNTYNIHVDKNTGETENDPSIFTGDPVIFDTGQKGHIKAYPFAQNGTDEKNTTPVLGVFQGCEYTLPTGELVKSSYWPGKRTNVMPGSHIRAFVLDDPYIVYDIQVSTWDDNEEHARLGANLFGSNCGLGLGGDGANVKNPSEGSMRTGQSAAYLAIFFFEHDNEVNGNTNVSSKNDSPTLPLKILGYTLKAENYPTEIKNGAEVIRPYLNARVIINNHVFKTGTTGFNFK